MVVLSIFNKYNGGDAGGDVLFPCSGVWAQLTHGTDITGTTTLRDWSVGVAVLCVTKRN